MALFGGFQKERGASVDLLLHFVTRTSKATGDTEDIDYRVKLVLQPQDALAGALDRLAARSAYFGLKGDVAWHVLCFRGDDALPLDRHAPIASFKLSNAVREVRQLSLSVTEAFADALCAERAAAA